MDYGGYKIWCGSHDCEQVERNASRNISSSSRDRKNCKTEKQPDRRLIVTPWGLTPEHNHFRDVLWGAHEIWCGAYSRRAGRLNFLSRQACTTL